MNIDALEVIRREREEMEKQYAALREENEKLKQLISSDERINRNQKNSVNPPTVTPITTSTGSPSVARNSSNQRISRGRVKENDQENKKKITRSIENEENRTDDEDDEIIQYSSSDNENIQTKNQSNHEIDDEFYLDNESSEENSPEISPIYSNYQSQELDSDMDDSNRFQENTTQKRRRSISSGTPNVYPHQNQNQNQNYHHHQHQHHNQHQPPLSRPISASKIPERNSQNGPLSTQSSPLTSTSKSSSPSTNQYDFHQQDQFSNLPFLLWKGGILWKIPFNGRGLPERRLVMIKRATRPSLKSKPVRILGPTDLLERAIPRHNSTNSVGYISFPPTIIWANPEKPDDLSNARELSLTVGAHLVEGHQSAAFWKTQSRGTPLPAPQFCFSVMTNSRSLDLAAESIQEALAWKEAFHILLIMMSSNTDWAIEKLHRTKPTWRHDSLDNPPPSRKKDQIPSTPFNEKDVAAEQAYEKAARKSRTSSTNSLKDQMFDATRAGDYDTLCSILNTKISVNLMSGELQDTPLMIACRYGMDDIARLCLNYGARNDPHPEFGQTALHCAIESKSFGCARVLLDAAAPSGSDSLIANLKDVNGYSSLHLACKVGDLRIAKLLVGHGADISLRDQHLRTSLHACSYYGHKTMLSYFLDSGGDGYLELVDSDGRTALHYAAECGHLHCVKLLLETAANPVAQDSNHQTPYQVAYRGGHEKVCELLLEYQRNVPDGLRISDTFGGSIRSQGPETFPIRNTNNGWTGRASTGQLPDHVGLTSSHSDPQLPQPRFNHFQHPQQPQPHRHPQLQHSFPSPVPLTRNFSCPIQAPASPLDPEILTLPRPHTNRPSSGAAHSIPSTSHLSSPNTQLRFGSNGSPLSSPRTQKSLFGMRESSPLTVVEIKSHSIAPEIPIVPKEDLVNKDQPILPRPSTQKFASSPLHSRKKATEVIQTFSPASVLNEKSSKDNSETSQNSFHIFEGEWNIYQTGEGHLYYLESHSQHSQWEDPRSHGILVYNEKTGGYVRCSKLPQYQSLQKPSTNFTPQKDNLMTESFSSQSPQLREKEQEQEPIPKRGEDSSVDTKSNSNPSLHSDSILSKESSTSPQSVKLDQKLFLDLSQVKTSQEEISSTNKLNQNYSSKVDESQSIQQSHEASRSSPSLINSRDDDTLENDELLEEVLGADEDRCEVCSESGDVSGLLEFHQAEESNSSFHLERSLESHLNKRNEATGFEKTGKQDLFTERKSQNEIENVEMFIPNQASSSNDSPKPLLTNNFLSSTSTSSLFIQSQQEEGNGFRDTSQLEVNQNYQNYPSEMESNRKNNSQNSGKFLVESSFELQSDQPEESSIPLESSHSSYQTEEPRLPIEPQIQQASISLHENNLRTSLSRSSEFQPTQKSLFDTLPQQFRSDDVSIPLPVELGRSQPPSVLNHDSDWDESEGESPPKNQQKWVSQSNSSDRNDEDTKTKTKPKTKKGNKASTLTAEELERQKIFSSEIGGYGNGGSLFESTSPRSLDSTSMKSTIQQINEVLVTEFPFCLHVDLLISAIQSLDQMGGNINSQKLANLLSALPLADTFPEVLMFIRSQTHSHPYLPGELLCQAIASFYSSFCFELEGFTLLLDVTSSLPAMLHSLRQMIDICNEILASSQFRQFLQRFFDVLNETKSSPPEFSLSQCKDQLQNNQKIRGISMNLSLLSLLSMSLPPLIPHSGVELTKEMNFQFDSPLFHSEYFSQNNSTTTNQDLLPPHQIKSLSLSLLSNYSKLIEVRHHLSLSQSSSSSSSSKRKIDDYLRALDSSLVTVTHEIEILKSRHEELTRKTELVFGIFEGKIRLREDRNLLEIFNFIQDVNNMFTGVIDV